jgi:OOP family OmpA-OmpF porin
MAPMPSPLCRTVKYGRVRIEVPSDAEGGAAVPTIEQALQDECRSELPGIYFAFGTAQLDDASDRALSEVVTVVKRHPKWSIAIEGHTDDIGSDAANQALAEARASAVRAYLLAHGVGGERVAARGFGETQPRESNSTLEGRARNRRVELVRPCEAAR